MQSELFIELEKWIGFSHVFVEKTLLTFKELYACSMLMFVHKYKCNYRIKEPSRLTRSAQYIAFEIPRSFRETTRHQLCFLGPTLFNKLIERLGNNILFEKKPKVKMKILECVSDLAL